MAGKSSGRGRRRLIKAPIGVCDEVKEFGELVDVFCLAPCGEHVVCQIINVVPLPVERIYENFQLPPAALNCIGVGASIRVNETDSVINGLMRVTWLFERMVRRPTIANDFGDRFDPSTNNGRQRFSGSILNGNENRSTSPRSTPSNIHWP
jgi:hypothetical protein